MKRKKKIKDAVSLKTQSIAHEKLSQDNEIEVKEETREYWKKEATHYQQQLDEIIDKAGFPDAYIQKIGEEARERGNRLYKKRKQELAKEKQNK